MRSAKKILILALALMLALAVLAGCDKGGDAQSIGSEAILEKYANTAEATRITQNIECFKDDAATYKFTKTLEKADGVYNVHEEESKLSKVEVDAIPDDAFTTTQNDYTLTAEEEAKAALDIKEEYFKVGYTVTATSLKAQVKDANVKEFLALGAELPETVKDLEITLTADENAVTKIEMTCVIKDYEVKIEITYEY